MTITDIRNHLKQSMLQKDTERTSVIRMLLSAISYSAMSNNKKDEELTESDIANVILKEIKTRSEAVEDYESNGKVDLAMKEKSELNILKEFAPQMMSEDEVRSSVKEILSTTDANIAFGPAMGLVMKSLKGKAETAVVNKVLNEELKK